MSDKNVSIIFMVLAIISLVCGATLDKFIFHGMFASTILSTIYAQSHEIKELIKGEGNG